MRILFFGTPELAVPSLAAVHERFGVAAVVCQPDKPKGRSGKPAPPPVKEWALARGIPVHQPAKLNDGSFEAWMRDQRPDLCLVTAYGRLLKQPLLDIPPLGWLNMHPSLLPRWRGPSPIQTALLHGDAETGVTIMKISLEMDAGDIVLQERTPVGPEENAETLTARLAAMGGRMLADAVALAADGELPARPQGGAGVTYCKMLAKEDGRIRWDRPAAELHNLVRAMVPWPTAQCIHNGEVFKILAATVADGPADAAPGTVTAVLRDRILVAAGGGRLAILRLQAPGKKAMDTAAFLLGNPMKAGDRFGETG